MNLDAVTPIRLIELDFAVRLTLTLVHFLWQGCAIAAAAAMAAACLRGAPANARYGVYLAALMLMAACPPVTYRLMADQATGQVGVSAGQRLAPLPAAVSPPAGVASQGAARRRPDGLPASPRNALKRPAPGESQAARQAVDGAAAGRSLLNRYASHAALAYLVGVVWMLGRLTISLWGGRRWRVAAARIEAGEVAAMAARQARRLGLKARPVVAWCQRTTVPLVVGIVKPTILLPAMLASRLDPEQLEAILAHELAHIRRGDLLVNLLQRLVEAGGFFHPAVWYVSRKLSFERETACDDLVLAAGWQRLHYASALVRMAELSGGLRSPGWTSVQTAANGGRPSELKRRVVRLLEGPAAQRIYLSRGGSIVLGLVLIVCGAATLWVAADRAPAQPQAAHREKAARSDLTPAKIAEHIEAAMRQFGSVEYRAEYQEVRDANAFFPGRRPLLVEGSGTYVYRGDGNRWLIDEEGFSIDSGQEGTLPRHVISGFDGGLHFTSENGRVTLGEDDLSNQRLAPRVVLWEAGRTSDWLLAALRRDEARISRRITIRGHECIVVVSEWGSGAEAWRYEITVSPEQSWLPLRCRVEYGGERYSDAEVSELARTGDGVWYPAAINAAQHRESHYVRKQVRVTSLRLREAFEEEEFRLAVPTGSSVTDYRQGYSWYTDPWYSELEPWLRDRLDWPRPDAEALVELQSYADAALQGQAAPEIEAAEWLHGDPGDWNRAGRRVTVLFFFGGQAIAPTPRHLAAIKTLSSRYREAGLDVIGVATASDTPELTRQAVQELEADFPVALDRRSEQGFGRTFNAYGLQAYAGVLVVDGQAKVRLVQAGQAPGDEGVSKLEDMVRRLLAGATAEAAETIAGIVPGGDGRLTDAEASAIAAEWKRRAGERAGEGRIAGEIRVAGGSRDSFSPPVDGPTSPGRLVQLHTMPILRMLFSNNPYGYQVFHDASRGVDSTSDPNGNYALRRLRKGTYVVTFKAGGFATIEREIDVASDDATVTLDVLMHQADRIAGRVTDEAGRPIAGAKVRAIHRHLDPKHPRAHTTAHLPNQPALSQDDGRFAFDELYEGAFTLEVTAGGFLDATVEAVPAGKQDLSIRLKALP